ncbi:hypothetical protein [uncultured Propionibacterium sp.]|uniref:hypothetical protein n=1 Tax=uncultured Propionibacterium sp. TaxID=218066 RepID=UPI00292FBADF|nr:hypothetical protein [uncultured Propionibacterium sp.]
MGLFGKSGKSAENPLPKEILEVLVNSDNPPPEEMWEAFFEKYEPSADLVKPSARTVRACE